jgi:hypothetical protein
LRPVLPAKASPVSKQLDRIWMLLTYSWIAAESLLYAAQLRRRLALGLTDTLTVRRFRRWGGALAWWVSPISLFSVLHYDVALSRVLWLFCLTQVLLIAASTNTWLAFFPSKFYQRMGEKRDNAVTAART